MKSEKMSVLKRDDDYFMGEALKEARQAFEVGEIPIGAVIVAQDRIIARAHNYTNRLHDVTAHAEMLAFTAAANALGGKYLNDCTLYVTVEPCPMCAGASYWAQIGRVVFGCEDPKRGASLIGGKIYHPGTKIEQGVRKKECADLMQRFFFEKRRTL